MGSEGYLINQFIAPKTNHRTDEWGGPFENRIRFAVEIVRRTREKVGPNFIIIFRLSMLDLVEDGSTWEEVVQLAKAIEAAGATIINTGIGWHEARIPTIATMVPRAAFTWVTRRMKGEVKIPLVTTNRINTPDVAEDVLARGDADMVSMARPFLADAEFVNKAAAGRADEINTCIACNQACLDHIFQRQTCSCLVNPRACHETELVIGSATAKKKIAVVGAGPAGLAFATTAAERGHDVTLFEASDAIGGQFNLAKRIPGKEEFAETLRYLPPPPRRHRRESESQPPRHGGRTRRGWLRPRRARHRRHAALARHSRQRPSQGGALHRHHRGPPRGRSQSRHRRRRRHRLRRRRTAHPRRRQAQRYRPLPQRVGHRQPRMRSAAA